MAVAEIIAGGVEAALGAGLLHPRPLGGGCMGEVYTAELSDGTPVVAKERAGGGGQGHGSLGEPAIYHADPEVEPAFISLFDTFGERFLRRYAELRDIRPGSFEERRHLCPLLVHVYFFGGGYPASVWSTLRQFGLR